MDVGQLMSINVNSASKVYRIFSKSKKRGEKKQLKFKTLNTRNLTLTDTSCLTMT